MRRLTSEDIRMLTRFRHDLHQHPELSRKEFRTTHKIREFLSALPGCRINVVQDDYSLERIDGEIS